MPPFDLEVTCKCNTPVEPTTQAAAEHTAGGVEKRSDDELDIVPNELSVTVPNTEVPCPAGDAALGCQPPPAPWRGGLGCSETYVQCAYPLRLLWTEQIWCCQATDGSGTARLMGRTCFGVLELEVTSGGLTEAHTVKVTCLVFHVCAAREAGCLAALSGSGRSVSSI